MNEPRNDYGFPLSDAVHMTQAGHDYFAQCCYSAMLALLPAEPTPLERAQAIAAEVRARKFPPITKLEAPRHEMP